MPSLATFYPICDACGEIISLRDDQHLGNLALTPENIPKDLNINQVRKGFARSSTYGNPNTPESKICAAIGEKAEANWHASRDTCSPDQLFA